MNLPIKKLYEDSILPIKAHETDAAFDCFVHNIEQLALNKIKVGLGIAAEVPESYMLCISPRSSISKTNWQLANSMGIVDNGYNKEIFVVFNTFFVADNDWTPILDQFPYSIGDRCCQIFLLPILKTTIVEVDEVFGNRDGFGSTGK